MPDTLNTVDLFCGAGGLSLGFERHGFRTLVANDYHPDPCETFATNFEHVDPVVGDIVEIAAEDLMEEGQFNEDDVDVVIGGPPCKGFSLAGERKPDDPRNFLFKEYIRIVESLDPSAIVMENVTGILSMKNGEYKNQILSNLRDLGYQTEFQVLNAADYGTPQHRKRVIFIGHKKGINIDFPEPTHFGVSKGQKTLGQISESDREKYITIGEAIGDLKFLGSGESATEYESEPQSEYQEEMREKTSRDGLTNHVAPNHSERIQKRFSLMDPGKGMESLPEEHQTAKQRMIKLDPSDQVDTITTLPEDFVHYSRNRIPTVREMARLQSFPDHFEFKGPRTTGGQRRTESVPQYSQVGNAVPPRLAAAVAKEVKKGLLADKQAL